MSLRATLAVLAGMLVWMVHYLVAWSLAALACAHPPAEPAVAPVATVVALAALAGELAAARHVASRQPPGLYRFAGLGLTVIALAATVSVGLASWLAPVCG